MKSIYLDFDVPRMLATYLAGALSPRLYLGPTSPLRYGEVPEPKLPSPHWVKVRSMLSGICGTDVAAITMQGSTALFPVMPKRTYLGHEVVGEVLQVGSAVTKVRVGERIVLDCMVSCEHRGIRPVCPMCARGANSVCENLTEPEALKGVGVGFSDHLGGGWSERLVCHEDQCVKIPDGFSWEEALMTEMLAVAMRGILPFPPEEGEWALVIGAGPIGLAVLQVLKALFPGVRVLVAARYPHQEAAARRLGADETAAGDLYGAAQELVGARIHRPPLARKPTVFGGFENIYVCVGTAAALEDAVHLARAKGRVALLGCAYKANIDWTMVWFKELTIHGSMVYATETWQGEKRRTFELAVDLMRRGQVDLKGLVTHRFQLNDYKRAILTLLDKRAGEDPIKVAFLPNG